MKNMIRNIIFITSVTFSIIATAVIDDYEDPRFTLLKEASDVIWCEDDFCLLYKSNEIIERSEDMPIGMMILVNDDTFGLEEMEKYRLRLMAHWVDVLGE